MTTDYIQEGCFTWCMQAKVFFFKLTEKKPKKIYFGDKNYEGGMLLKWMRKVDADETRKNYKFLTNA